MGRLGAREKPASSDPWLRRVSLEALEAFARRDWAQARARLAALPDDLAVRRLCQRLEAESAKAQVTDLGKLVDQIDHEFALVKPLYESERQRF